MKALIVQSHRRQWEQCPRLCVVCGESHAHGQPTPSGRECKKIIPVTFKYYHSAASKIGRPPKVIATSRTCAICTVEKLLDQFNGVYSYRCLICVEKQKAQSIEKQKAHNQAWRAKNIEHVKRRSAIANKRHRDKQKLKKEATDETNT